MSKLKRRKTAAEEIKPELQVRVRDQEESLRVPDAARADGKSRNSMSDAGAVWTKAFFPYPPHRLPARFRAPFLCPLLSRRSAPAPPQSTGHRTPPVTDTIRLMSASAGGSQTDPLQENPHGEVNVPDRSARATVRLECREEDRDQTESDWSAVRCV